MYVPYCWRCAVVEAYTVCFVVHVDSCASFLVSCIFIERVYKRTTTITRPTATYLNAVLWRTDQLVVFACTTACGIFRVYHMIYLICTSTKAVETIVTPLLRSRVGSGRRGRSGIWCMATSQSIFQCPILVRTYAGVRLAAGSWYFQVLLYLHVILLYNTLTLRKQHNCSSTTDDKYNIVLL